MTSQAVLLTLACFLLINTTRVSSKRDEEILLEASPIYKGSPPPTSPVVSAPPPPSPVTKAPTPPLPLPNAPPPWPPSPVTNTPPQVKAPIPPPPLPNAPPSPPQVTKTPPPPPPPVAKTPPAPVAKTPPTPPPPVKEPTPPPPYVKPPRTRQDCIPLCVVRCKNHSRKNVCMRACLTCCERCKCVPPGQYGNKEKCGKCYANMTTRGGKLKCP